LKHIDCLNNFWQPESLWATTANCIDTTLIEARFDDNTKWKAETVDWFVEIGEPFAQVTVEIYAP